MKKNVKFSFIERKMKIIDNYIKENISNLQ